MSEFKGTRGNWHINHWSKGDGGVRCIGLNRDGVSYFTGDAVCEKTYGIRSKIDPMDYNVQGSFEGAHIAEITDFSKESLYNALLISKAPEMLEMLEEFVDNFDNDNIDNFIMANSVDKAKELIKSATEI